MADFTRKTLEFTCQGMSLSLPADKLAPGQYRFLKNCRPRGENQIWGRIGIVQEAALNGSTDAIHSIKRMNDPVPSPTKYPGAFKPACRIVGAGTNLYQAIDALNDLGHVDSGFSGDPLSICIVKPDFTPRPHVIIADSLKMRKLNSAGLSYQVGLTPPNDAPSAAMYETMGDGPDIGDAGQPYLYRFGARTDAEAGSGALSALGPAMRDEDGLSPGGTNDGDPAPGSIEVKVITVHPDPRVAQLDVYRFGGTLLEWIWIGTAGNYAGGGFVDTFSDADIAANPRADTGPDTIRSQPWRSTEAARSGTCTISNKYFVTISGTGAGEAEFNPYDATGDSHYDVIGNEIVVAGRLCHFRCSPTTAVLVEVVEDLSDLSGTLDWQMAAPDTARNPLPFLWGPFGGGETGTFLFSVGDELRPGAILWTRGNDPESHPPANILDITEPTERMQNGCMFDGRSYAFSTERMFAIYPSFGQASQFVAIEVPGSRGLYRRWAICSNGPAIFSRARDGIYASVDTGSICISGDIAKLFGSEREEAPGNPYDGITGLTIPVPDPAEEEAERLSFADGYLYWEFKATDGNRYTMVYDADPRSHGRPDTAPGWISLDSYAQGVTFHYQEEGENSHTVLMGTLDGRLARYDGYSDMGTAISGAVRGFAFNGGDPRPRKQWGDVWLDYDSDCDQITWRLGFDKFTFFSETFETAVNLTGSQQAIGDINEGTGQFAANVGVDLSWSATVGQPKLYAWQPSWIPKPEVTAKRVTDWTDCGYPGDKFFQGVRLTADTLAQARSINIHKDGGALAVTLPVTHSGEITKPYSFASPFISHKVRLLPTDDNFWRLIDAEWIWEPAPELTENWITQNTNLDFDGFFHHHHACIALISSDVVTWEVRVDGVSYTYTIPSTGGVPAKPRVILQPMKGKIVEYYKLTCPSGFRLFQRDCEVWAKQWGSTGPYIKKTPFGDISRLKGAAI